MTECSKSPDGMHHIPRAPPDTKVQFEEFNKLSEVEKRNSGRCIYCGVAIW